MHIQPIHDKQSRPEISGQHATLLCLHCVLLLPAICQFAHASKCTLVGILQQILNLHLNRPEAPLLPQATKNFSSVLSATFAQQCFNSTFDSVFAMLQDWICNSSICMTRRGLKPTGIAIFEAQQQGFASVAHHLQVCSLLHSGSTTNVGCPDLKFDTRKH